jgi:hypothetical protein
MGPGVADNSRYPKPIIGHTFARDRCLKFLSMHSLNDHGVTVKIVQVNIKQLFGGIDPYATCP